MSELFFVKVTDDYAIKKESYYVNCNEIKSFGCFYSGANNKLIYYVKLPEENHNIMCLHIIRKSDYERLKKL